MSRDVDEQTPAEHLLREWLANARDEVLDDIRALEDRGLEVAYADLHSEGAGVLFLALPYLEDHDTRPTVHAMAWFSVEGSGHHVRYLSLRHLVAVSLDEEADGTRLSLHFTSPISTCTLLAKASAQRGQARTVAESLQDWLVRGWA